MLAGFRRLYKGQVVDEVYTQINQPDYSAETAQLQAARPEALFLGDAYTAVNPQHLDRRWLRCLRRARASAGRGAVRA